MRQSRHEVTLLRRLGLRIKVRRTHCCLSQVDLGDAAGLDRTYVSRVERGAHNVTVLTLVHIAEALEVAPGELLDSALADDDRVSGLLTLKKAEAVHPRPAGRTEPPAHGSPLAPPAWQGGTVGG
jgi:transcriptional regulator with XRE-family HTH domain